MMKARFAILCLALLLTACSGRDAREPFTDSRIPPNLGPADWPPDGWTWGLVQAGKDPAQRYGMAGPADVSRGQVLILPGYGQAAEDEYRLARSLIAHRFEVWVLDGAGQGGSGRQTGTRDLGQVDDFKGDLATIGAMIDKAIPSDAEGPLILVAASTAAPLALRRLQQGGKITGVVLLAPTDTGPTQAAPLPTAPMVQWARRVGLGRMRAAGQKGWTSTAPEIGADPAPQTHRAWRAANPDLRMGGPSYDWLAAYRALNADVARTGLNGIAVPALLLRSANSTKRDASYDDHLCRALPRCVQARFEDQGEADQKVVSFAETLAVQGLVTPKGLLFPSPSPRASLTGPRPRRGARE